MARSDYLLKEHRAKNNRNETKKAGTRRSDYLLKNPLSEDGRKEAQKEHRALEGGRKVDIISAKAREDAVRKLRNDFAFAKDFTENFGARAAARDDARYSNYDAATAELNIDSAKEKELSLQRELNKARRSSDMSKRTRLNEELAEARKLTERLEREREEYSDYERRSLIRQGYREPTFSDYLRAPMKGYEQMKLGTEKFKEMSGLGGNAEAYEEKLNGEKYRYVPRNDYEGAVLEGLSQIGTMGYVTLNPRTLAGATAAGGAAALAGQAGPQVVAPEEIVTVPAAAITGATAAGATVMYEAEAGLAYDEMIKNGVSPNTARNIAVGVGTVNALIESAQIDELIDITKVLLRNKGTKSFGLKMAETLTKAGVSITGNTLEEVAQEGSTIAGAQIANKVDKGEWAYTGEEVAERLGDTAKSAAMSFGMLTAPSVAVNVGMNAIDARKNTVASGADLRYNEGNERGVVNGREDETGNGTGDRRVRTVDLSKLEQPEAQYGGSSLSRKGNYRTTVPRITDISDKRITETDIVEPAEGSVGQYAKIQADEYNVPCHIVSDEAFAREGIGYDAYSRGGQVYIRESADDSKRDAYIPHEVSHVMKQTGYAPYMEFVGDLPEKVNMSSQNTSELIEKVAKHRKLENIELTSLTQEQTVDFWDEFNAMVYGTIQKAKAQGNNYEWYLGEVLHDLDGYVAGMDSLHNDFKAHNKKNAPAPVVRSAPFNVMSNEAVDARRTREAGIRSYYGFGEHGARTFADVMDSMPVDSLATRAFSAAYEAGRTNLSPKLAELKTDVQIKAFEAGLKDHNAETKSKEENVKNVVSHGDKAGFDGNGKPSDVTETEIEIVDKLYKAMGVKGSLADGLLGNAELKTNIGISPIARDFQREAEIDGEKRKVSIVYHAAHEIAMHRLMELAPKEGQAFINALYRYMGVDNVKSLAEAKREAYAAQGVEISLSEAMEEVAANQILALYNWDEAKFAEAVDRIVNGKNEQAKQGASKFKQILDSIIAKLNSVLESLGLKKRAELNELVKLRDLFETAFAEAVAKNKEIAAQQTTAQKNTSGEVKHSIRHGFAAEIDAWDGKSKVTFDVGTTSKALKSIGIKNRRIVWHGGKISEILRKHENMSKEIIKQVPEMLEEPIVVLKSQNSDSRITVFGEVTDIKGNPVLAVLELEPTAGNGRLLNLNIVASAYGKDSNPAGFIKNSELLYLDANKNRTKSWLQSVGLQLPSDTTTLGSIGTITYIDGKVNIKGVPYEQYMQGVENNAGKSSQKRNADSRGHELTAEQKNTDLSGGDVKSSLKNKNLTINSRIPYTSLGGYIAVAKGDSVALENLESAVKTVTRGTYTNDATGYSAKITSDTISKAIRPARINGTEFTEEHIRNLNAMIKLPELFKAAVYVDSKPEQKPKNQNKANKEYHHFVAPVLIGNDTYRALITAREKINSNTLYVLQVEVLPMQKRHTLSTAQQKAGGSRLLSVPSDVSIPDLVNGVKIHNYDTGITDIYSGKDIKFSLKGTKATTSTEEKLNGRAKHSIKDSEGRTLSEGQQEYFKDSKVRDENGNLKVVYHGTSKGGFTWFDTYAYYSKFGLFGNGAYFTENKGIAEEYTKKGRGNNPQVYSVYLNISNPIDMDEKADIDAWNEAIRKSGEEIELLQGEKTNEQAFKSIVEDLEYLEVYSYDAAEIVRNIFESMGYNGITHMGGGRVNTNGEKHRVWIAFEPEQIKNIDNANPTADPDIRFSLRNQNEVSLQTMTNVRKAISDNDVTALAKYAEKGVISTEYYNQLVEKYGAIPKGENPHRDVVVPQRTEKNKKVSQTVRTILEAKATPDEAVPTIEKMVEDGVFSYDVYTDKEAIADAEKKLRDEGWAESFSKWLNAVNKGKVTKKTTVTGWALYNNAANIAATTTSETERREAVQTSLTILDAMVKHQRSAAQALQATRVLKKLSPETQLYGVQKSVQALQKELEEKYGDKAPDLKIDEDLAEQFLNAKTEEERTAAKTEIYKDIGKQMPSRFADKWNAWRYLAMLGNVRTHVRNVGGNAGFAPVVVLGKDLAATAIESVVYLLSGKKTARSKAFVGVSKADRALLAAAWEDYANVADVISNGGKYSDFAMANKAIEEGRQIFKTKPLEWARKKNSELLEMEDVWFSKPHYAYALAQYCKANKITAEQLKRGKALGAAREYAIKEAQKATYRDTNIFSQLVSELGRVDKNEENLAKKALSTVAVGILPFRKTPANILVRGVEYSPLGLLKGITWDLYRVSKGEITSAEAIDNISAGLTGTGLLLLGLHFAKQGLIRGRGEDDEEKEFKELMGHQAYALELPNGTSVTLDWLAPEALPFFVGVNIWEATKGKKEEVNVSTILQVVSGITEPMLEMSCLQSLNDVFESVGYASSNDMSGLVSALSSAATSYLMQGLPTIFGQAERTGEETRMTTYTEKNAFLTRDMQYTLGKASAKIPFWDYHQIPYIDAWGRKEASGNALKRGLNNFLNPAYTSTIETSSMEKELLRLYEKTGEGGVFPERADKYFTVDGKRKDLTAEEYVKYATLKGTKSYELVSDLVKSKTYKSLSDEEKAEAVRKAYDYANQKAKKAIANYKPETWVTHADKFGDNVSNFISFRTEVGSKRDDNGGKISKQEVVDIALGMAQSDSELWNMYLSEYNSKADVHLHEFGIEGEDYMTVIKKLDVVDQPNKSGKLGTYTNDEIAAAISMVRGLDSNERAELWQSMTGSTSTKNNPWR
ncbi:MAG: hypothetical protein IJN09_03705 [Oscillospiraceae bacterium]|nr:hypothetical protein [Oscillospiraceae bacterium]